jgi:hypothetical protein
MKFKYLLSVIISFLLMTSMLKAAIPGPNSGTFTQGTGDTIFITSGIAGNLETVINSDINADSSRHDSIRVYVLSTGLYEQNAGLVVKDSTGTLSIVGNATAGKQRPVWYRNEVGGLLLNSNNIAANLVLKNVDYESMDLSGKFYPGDNGDFVISTFNKKVELDNNLISYNAVSTINAQSVKVGFQFIARGNYFRNFLSDVQWWLGRVLYAKVPVDTLIFENNTVSGGGLTLLEQNSLTAFCLMDHNTFINNEKYVAMNPFYLEGYFTDNIFLNCGIAGEDSINVMWSQDVDHLRTGLIQVDTLMSKNLTLVQPKFLTGGAKDASKLGLSNIQWYVADNIAAMETNNDAWNKYISGASPYSDGAVDSASSFLGWKTTSVLATGDTETWKPPFGVTNFMEWLVNSRGLNLAKDHKNIAISASNQQYTIAGQDLGFKTAGLDTAKANFWIAFNRCSNAYSVPGAAVPVAYGSQTNPDARFAYGSFNPSNIPGPGAKEIVYTAAKGGITKFTDLPENFAPAANFVSQIDGLPIGSQIWSKSPAAIPADELTSIKAAYANYQAGNDFNSKPSVDVATAASTLSVGPNPTSGVATITFDLQGSNVLTVTDLSGNVVETIANVTSPYTLDASGLANGLYIIVLKSDQTVLTSKLVKQ